MRFGERFINLLNTDLGASGRGETADLAVAIRAAEAAVPSGPGTLYLGSTAFLAEDLVIADRFELLLSPSARIIVLAGATLTVLGPIDLERRLHFACHSGARVRLLGPLEAIHPEWWGAPHDIALDAARRLAVDRISEARPQVPIRLRGPYALTSTFQVHANELSVEGAEPMSPSLVFEGEFPRGDQGLEPTFRHDPAAVGGFILVDVGPDVAVVFRHVAFEGGTSENAGLPLVRACPSRRSVGLWRMAFERCSFFSEACDAVWVAAVGPTAPLPSEAPGIEFLDCWFQSDAEVPQKVTLLQTSSISCVALVIDGCSFVGPARAAIAVPNGMSFVTNCDFSNSWHLPDDEALAQGYLGGVDVLMGSYAQRGIVGLPGLPIPLGSGPARVIGTFQPSGPLMLHALHVRTRSLRHVYSACAALDPGTCHVALTGVVQGSAPRGESLMTSPPAMLWVSDGSPAPLLQGCHFQGTVTVLGSDVVRVASELVGSPPLRGDGRELTTASPLTSGVS